MRRRRFSVFWVLFLASTLLTTLIVLGMGGFIFFRDYRSFRMEARHLEEESFKSQQQLIRSEVERVVQIIEYDRSRSESRLQAAIKERAEEAWAIAAHLYDEHHGSIGDAELKRLILDALRPIRFNNGQGYYFVTGLDGVVWLSASHPELEGQSLLNLQDTQGAYVVRDMIDLVTRESEGFYRYSWTKPQAEGRGFPKIAYIKRFAPLNCFIGTGAYLDDAEQDIQRRLLNRISKIRFGQEGYIFVVNYDGLTLMNGVQPELIGQNLWEMTDPYGVKVIQEEHRAAETPGGDFIRYHWQKPSTGEVRPKLSFVMGIPEWRWMVGAGVYTDEVVSLIAAKEADVRRELIGSALGLAIILLSVLLISHYICYRLSGYFTHQLDLFLSFFRDMEKGGIPIVTEGLVLTELYQLGLSANAVLERRQQMEAGLRDREQELERAQSIAHVGSYAWEKSSGKLVWSRELLRMSGCEGKEPSKELMIALLHPEDRDWVLEARRRALKTATVFDAEYRIVCPNGELRWHHDRAEVEPQVPGAVTRLYGTVQDVTERKKAEEEREQLELQLRQAQKLEAIGTLAGGIAHDFNNLLQVINGYTELVIEELGAEQPSRATLAEVAKAGSRAAQLVGQLLAFSRRQVLQPENLDLNEVISQLLKMLGRLIGEHIHLEFIPGHRLGAVFADRGMIEQILVNLCVNARDAMPEGGTLTLESENVCIDERYCQMHPWALPGRYVLVSVTDTGNGMDKETLGRIFEPFFTTKGPGQGTGLGLAMVYGIVKQHQGMTHVYSEPGKGTTFKIYVPMAERLAGDVGTKLREASAGGGETILLAEDEQMVRDLAVRILERAGYRVMVAHDGEAALVLFRKWAGEVDLLFLDVVMPGLGGRGVYEKARTLKPEIPVLFTSGYTENAVHTNFVLKEGFRLLQKPFSREDLLQSVREVLDSRPQRPSA